jgi:hypothetical protein
MRYQNVSNGGFLVESWQDANVRDTMEFRIKGIALIGEVIHREEAGSKWQVGVKAEHRGGGAQR